MIPRKYFESIFSKGTFVKINKDSVKLYNCQQQDPVYPFCGSCNLFNNKFCEVISTSWESGTGTIVIRDTGCEGAFSLYFEECLSAFVIKKAMRKWKKIK